MMKQSWALYVDIDSIHVDQQSDTKYGVHNKILEEKFCHYSTNSTLLGTQYTLARNNSKSWQSKTYNTSPPQTRMTKKEKVFTLPSSHHLSR